MEGSSRPDDSDPGGGAEMKLVVGSDHAALELRRFLASKLAEAGHEITEVGAQSMESYDYPDAADAAVEALNHQGSGFAILICGTGIGISIRANRHPGIRAALCTTEFMARMAREHNHANVLCLGARVLGTDQALSIVQAFLVAGEDPGPRHLKRIEKLDSTLSE